mmetsp:Transcript_60548/g.107966  ORF Transcript_60548/g.107966 Transcript_60548/m.107966 type:complete len:102 (-) Transcript_60548:394-699(-)
MQLTHKPFGFAPSTVPYQGPEGWSPSQLTSALHVLLPALAPSTGPRQQPLHRRRSAVLALWTEVQHRRTGQHTAQMVPSGAHSDFVAQKQPKSGYDTTNRM